MNRLKGSVGGTGIRSLAFCSLFLAGCAGQKSFWGDPSSGLILRYRTPGTALRYESSSKMQQQMTFGEQPFQIDADSRSVVTMKPAAGNPVALQVTIDSTTMKSASPMGDMSPDLSGLTGRPFGMTLSVLGKETLAPEAASIQVDLGQMGGKRGVQADFADFFENLPAVPVRVGESWNSMDTVTVEQGGMNIVMVVESRSTLTGLEKVRDLECCRIAVESKGKMSGSGEQMGAKLSMTGDIQSKGTWAFAYKKGLMAESSVETTTESTVEISGPEDMTMPMKTSVKTLKILKN
ncbi:MAG: hypothetical protein QUS35_12155 [bacterium]|nr:hypothetical protein [bacterium]